jgi:hypothetical protein
MMQRAAGHDRRSGATLLIVLALVTVVSILLIAYLGTVQSERTATQSYSGEITATQIAMGGLDRQVADLEQEIKAGSTAFNGPTATSPVYYQPISPPAIVPARYNDTGYNYTNVVRVSSANSAFYQAAFPAAVYPGQVPPNLAVASSTANESPDGRYLSATRWQAPQLLLPAETNIGIMPVPDWILMTRNGPTNAAGLAFGSTGNTLNNRNPSNPNYVVGRYAYIVYDEGGLLDATVAGASSGGAGAPSADDSGNRGSLALAALTNSVFTPAQINALSGWRNAATDASESSYTNYVYNTQATNGFLAVQPGDNTFLSRQDLIAYADYAGITSALPYLGTFNRAVNAPAYTPAAVTTQNPDLLTLRYANGGTINSSGTLLQSHTVQAGDFLLSRRFPLSRLSWVGYNGPANGASAYDVWRAFGLVWDNTNNAWAYVSGSGSSLPAASAVKNSIETLALVSQENPQRDPDFFELLQAGILNGSLGQTGGGQLSYNDAAGNLDLVGGSGDTSGYDSVPSYHLIQIGVNIIDQARADNFPTAIEFGPDSRDKFVAETTTGLPATPNGKTRTFYGVKNLPYISRFMDTFVRFVTPPPPLSNSDVLPNGAFPGKVYKQPFVGCWEQFELWNPHQVPPAGSGPVAANPSAIRITAVGEFHGDVYSRNGSSAGAATQEQFSYNPTYAPSGTTLSVPSGAQSEVTWSTPSAFIQLPSTAWASFSEPKLVANGDVDTSGCTANCVQDGSKTVPGPGTPFVGLYIGSSYAPDWNYCAGKTGTKYPAVVATSTADPACLIYDWARINPFSPAGSTNPGVTYELQYLDPSNTWRTYSVVKNQTQTADSSFTVSTTTVSSWTIEKSDSGCRFGQRIDPRTDRFSSSKAEHSAGDLNANLVNASPAVNDTMRPDTGIGHSADACIPYGIWHGNSPTNSPPTPPGIYQNYYYLGGVAENTTSSTTYYQDPDGVQRRGDSAYDNSATTDGHPGIGNSSFSSSINLARPVFLNRPFRSVGELGYVDRDLPWKTLDFFTKQSGDAGLLDLFSVSDADVVAGTIDLNTRNAAALAEVLGGGAINPNHAGDSSASPITTSQGSILANALITATTTLPLRSRAEMVTTALDPDTGETALTTGGYTAQSAKIQREAAIRTLSEVGNARTWNLLIDIIAQSGRYPQTLSPGASFDSFIPEGERRYWLHVAIDRYTGKIVDRFLEPVQE